MDRRTIEAYDEYAETWGARVCNQDFWVAPYQWVSSRLPPGGRVLEIGTGTGRDARLFLTGGYDYTGVEPSKGLADLARRSVPGINVVEADIRDINIVPEVSPPGLFDGFWCIAVLMHLYREEIPGALTNLISMVREGAPGVIAVKDHPLHPQDGWQTDGAGIPAPRYYAWWSRAEFGEVLETAGFRVVEYHHETGWHIFYVQA